MSDIIWAFLLWTVLVAWGTSVWLKRNTPADAIREGDASVPPRPRQNLGFDFDNHRSPREAPRSTASDIQSIGLDSRDGALGRVPSRQDRHLHVSHSNQLLCDCF